MMPSSKHILREFPLIRFYFILGISVVFFIVELIAAHLTHALIIQFDAYHMMYNILSLITCIVTIKLCQKGPNVKNTFGWTRLHVAGAVANICFLSALGFSVTVEAIQTIIHASHHEQMHNPIWVASIGALGLLVNAICFFTIGGYTFHQGSFLDSHHPGEDVVISESVQAYVREGMKNRRRQSFMAIFRDCFGAVFVLLTATLVYYLADSKLPSTEQQPTDYVDPVITICTVLILGSLSYTLAKEAGHILLLTIPDHINVKSLVAEMKSNFPELYDIHDLHVWQLTPARIIASAHIVLQHTQGYIATKNNIVDFLHSKGISHITLQPEFLHLFANDASPCRRRKCFLSCEEDECEEKQCCNTSSITPSNSHQPINSSFSKNVRFGLSEETTDDPSVSIRLAPISSSPEEEYALEQPELEPMIQ